MARSTARKRALNTLYEADEKGQDILSLLAERLEHPGAQTPLPDYAVEIIQGVAQHKKDIDHLLGECSTRWKVSRMPVVDRNIMRIAVWEIVYNDEVPAGVSIDEALGLAKTLCDSDSPNFIYGVLTAAREQAENMATQQAAQAEESQEVADEHASEVGSDAEQVSGETTENAAEAIENTEKTND